jgi:DnaK suppressor protein
MNGLNQKQLDALRAALEQRRHVLLDQVALATAGPAVEEVETSPADSASNRTMNQLRQATSSRNCVQ